MSPESRRTFRAEAKRTFGAGHHVQHIVIRRVGHQLDDGPTDELEVYTRDELVELQALLEEILANTAP